MKNVLVLTDFSKNAEAAAEAGLLIAGKLHTDLLLFNTYINYETMTSHGGGAWIVDEYTDQRKKSIIGLRALTGGLEALSGQLAPEDHLPAIQSESDDSDLGLDVADIIYKKSVEMVVMGARSGRSDDIGFGADTNSVIECSTRPVLITPAETDLRKIHRILFATDFENGDIRAVEYMARLAKLFYWKLEIVHVCDSRDNHCDNKKAAFKLELAKLHLTGVNFLDINGKDVLQRLNRLVGDEPGTLLAMEHVQNSFLLRVFQHSLVRKALVNQKMPLLVFPSKMH